MPAKYVKTVSQRAETISATLKQSRKLSSAQPMKFVVTKQPINWTCNELHRVRERLVSQRTGIINQIRAFLLERGIAVRQGSGYPQKLPPANRTRNSELKKLCRYMGQRGRHLPGELRRTQILRRRLALRRSKRRLSPRHLVLVSLNPWPSGAKTSTSLHNEL
jgi:hypothetical protein